MVPRSSINTKKALIFRDRVVPGTRYVFFCEMIYVHMRQLGVRPIEWLILSSCDLRRTSGLAFLFSEFFGQTAGTSGFRPPASPRSKVRHFRPAFFRQSSKFSNRFAHDDHIAGSPPFSVGCRGGIGAVGRTGSANL